MRLAKAISAGGICSRRAAEKLIVAGEVTVNGGKIIDLATKVIDTDSITVQGLSIERAIVPKLWAYYKPVGLITSHQDTHNRPTVFENLKDLPRVISVGRLDLNSEGLLLLTNSSQLARHLELPSSKVQRVYKVRAYGKPELLTNWHNKKTVLIDGINYEFEQIMLLSQSGKNCWFKVILTQGKNREIRKVFAHFGMQVNRLIRTSYGPFILGKLKPGEWQEQKYNIFAKFLL